MKDKLISFGSCVSIFQPNLQRSFGTILPIGVISGPNVPSLYSWGGSVSYTSPPSIAFGTIDRWRLDTKDPMPLNRDQWVLWSTGTADLIRVLETKKSNITNHWSTTLPGDVQKDSPRWVRAFIDKMRRS
ncbi:hypothetical protein HYW44_02465 [Candidatus Daviesbacteria bacterium]|nr:hypothetical protein [Candidatus Daviesbacteria bacterium]